MQVDLSVGVVLRSGSCTVISFRDISSQRNVINFLYHYYNDGSARVLVLTKFPVISHSSNDFEDSILITCAEILSYLRTCSDRAM